MRPVRMDIPKKKKYKKEESNLQKDILELLQYEKIPAYRINSGATVIENRFIRFGVEGFSDIIAFLPPDGKSFAIETKSLIGKKRTKQIEFINFINKTGGVGIFTRSIDDVINIVNKNKLRCKAMLSSATFESFKLQIPPESPDNNLTILMKRGA